MDADGRAGDQVDLPEVVLTGGVANQGMVVRRGDEVIRPANQYSPAIAALLTELADTGFDGAPRPLGRDGPDRERFEFIDGDVAVPPYPSWAQSDAALASVARLLRRFHSASSGFDGASFTWSPELADPHAGTVVCHNDVCLENVVFRDGEAIALIDFDFAAPGRRSWDLAAFARMCVPVDDPVSRSRLGWDIDDVGPRLALVADSYGLDLDSRIELLDVLDDTIERRGEFVRRRVEAGDQPFVEMWAAMGGQARFDRRRQWWSEQRVAARQRLIAGSQ